MKDWHKQTLLYIAGREEYAAPENIRKHLEERGISKTIEAVSTACKGPLADLLVRHDQSRYNDDGSVRQHRYRYSLGASPNTLRELLDVFKHDRDLETQFTQTKYFRDMFRSSLTLFTKSLTDLKLSGLEICNHADKYFEEACVELGCGCDKSDVRPPRTEEIAETIYTINDDQLACTTAHLEDNLPMLRFILHYLSSDIETRRQLILDLIIDSQLTTMPAGEKIGEVYMARRFTKIATKLENANAIDYMRNISKETPYDWHAGELPFEWFESFFAQIKRIHSRYPYLFD